MDTYDPHHLRSVIAIVYDITDQDTIAYYRHRKQGQKARVGKLFTIHKTTLAVAANLAKIIGFFRREEFHFIDTLPKTSGDYAIYIAARYIKENPTFSPEAFVQSLKDTQINGNDQSLEQ